MSNLSLLGWMVDQLGDYLKALIVFGIMAKKQSSNTAQWIITGLERNIVSNLSKYYDLLEPNSLPSYVSVHH